MKLPITKKILIPSIAISIAVGIAIYFLNMPAWLLVERTEREAMIEIPESALSDFPKLKEALDKADESYNPSVPGTTSTKASFLEGYGILQAFESQDIASSENSGSGLIIENEGKQYRFNVAFQYDPPLL